MAAIELPTLVPVKSQLINHDFTASDADRRSTRLLRTGWVIHL
jgi:hypothetical protein